MMNDFGIERPFNWVVVENVHTDQVAFKITNGEFENVIVTIGKIAFDEGEDDCRMNFDYEVEVGSVDDDRKEYFEKSLGDMLLYVLVESIKQDKLQDVLGDINGSA